MKQLIINILIFAALLVFSSCEDYRDRYEEARQQERLYGDKITVLEEEERLIKGEYADAIETLNAIDETLSEMAERNEEMSALIRQKELTNDESEQQAILIKLKALKDANQQSDDRVRSLRSKAKSLKIENAQLQKTIARLDDRFAILTDSVNKVRTTIVNMQLSLDQLEQEVASTETDLTSAYATLKIQTTKLERNNADLEVTIVELQNKSEFIEKDAQAYIVCGNKPTLRSNDILRLLSARRLTPEYRTKIKELGTEFDYFNKLEVGCGERNIQYILPNRNPSSYSLQGPLLVILNKDDFWATSKAVVLVTD